MEDNNCREKWMRRALDLAQEAAERGEVPVGAVLVQKPPQEEPAGRPPLPPQLIAEAYNQKETHTCALHHAEVLAIQRASEQLGRWRLSDCSLYVTLEPCVMCAGAIVAARLKEVIYAAPDPKGGAVESLYQILSDPRLNHRPQVISGVLEEESAQLLKEFFKARRRGSAFP